MKLPLKTFLRSLPLLILVTGISLLCVSCASNGPTPVTPVATIPPQSDGSYLNTDGFLIVKTPVELHFTENSARRFPHTGYSIYDRNTHQLIRYIRNRQGQAGEFPSTVILPSGIYLVEARTVYHRPISFPVVIKPGTTTTVNIQGQSAPPQAITGDFYTLEAHGKPIGWLQEAAAQR